MIRPTLSRRASGFTLVELIIVIAIIGMLVAMTIPEWGRIQTRSQSIVCVNNLRQVGIGVLSYVAENDNTFPMIEPNPGDPVYDQKEKSEDGPETEYQVKPMLEALEPYGVTEAVLKCPTDIRRADSYFKTYNTSYQWRVTVDNENATTPMIYGGRRGNGIRIAKPSRVTICTDFMTLHGGRMNRLYGDGHVSKPF
jgi:prepilin-type N-terminal cleavage/methylation domain-containing protein/prepilin-type processing-associated H-X9-DG protein